VVLDEDANRIEVVVPDDQLSLAIGRRGQNVRLAAQLTSWDIVILTEEEESERRQEEFRARSQMFIDALEVDDVLAHLLVTEGFSSVEEVAFVPVEDLLAIEGFDEELSAELRSRAHTHLSEKEEEYASRRAELGVSEDFLQIEGLTGSMIVTLGEAGVKTRDDLADLASDELCAPEDGLLREYQLTEDVANQIIMAARAHWFDEEESGDVLEDSETSEKDGSGGMSDSVA
jgi:N utilization substance protein A